MAVISQINDIVNALLPAGIFTTEAAEPEFAKAVRTASVLIKSNSTISYEDIRRTAPGEIHTIFLRIATGRLSNSSFLYTADEVLAMMLPSGSGDATEERYNMYGIALQWAASKLVAAHLLATIPLQSTLKFYDVAKDLRQGAIEDIDRIVKLIDNNSKSIDTAKNTIEDTGQITLYIAHDLDLSSIPETSFNTPDLNSSPATYDATVDLKDSVFTYTGIKVPTGYTAYCYFYMTGQAIDADKDAIISSSNVKNCSSVSYKIEDIFTIPDNANIDTIITLLADNINIKTFDAIPSSTQLGNILVACERGLNKAEKQSAVKAELYPNTTTLKIRRATFNLAYRVNKLNFQVRRSSSKVSAELLTVLFYTIPTPNWNLYNNNISNLRSNSILGIPGLIYGQVNNYAQLTSTSPFSVLLKVDKSNVIPISIQDNKPDNISEDLASDGSLLSIDTLYFHAEHKPNISEFTGFSSNLILRIASTSYNASAPSNIEVNLMSPPILPALNSGTGLNSWDIPNGIGEEVAQRITEAIYQYTRITNINEDLKDNSNVLAINLGEYNHQYLNINRTLGLAQEINLRPDNTNTTEIEYEKDFDAGRVQIVGFKYKDQEFKIIIDIVEVPPELYIATGNYKNRRTLWIKGKKRSITIDTKVLNTNSETMTETLAQQLNSVKASVGKATATKSPLLQSVYDKKSLLREALKGFPNQWQKNI